MGWVSEQVGVSLALTHTGANMTVSQTVVVILLVDGGQDQCFTNTL